MTLLLTILKLVSTALAGAFGILALVVEYKHEGKITKWGRIALVGVIASTAVSLITQSLEFLNAEFDARKSALESKARLEQSERILQNLNTLTRATQPLQNPGFTVVLELPRDLPQGGRFLASLDELAMKLRSLPSTKRTHPQGFFVNSQSPDGTPLSIRIYPIWSGFPNRESEPELFTLLTQTSVEFSFLRSPKQMTSEIERFANSKNQPRLGYFSDVGDLGLGIGGGGEPQERTFDYDVEKKTLAIWIEGSAPERFVRRTGDISSVPDFDESFPLLAVDHTMVPKLNAGDFPALRKARNEMEPRTVFISANGRRYVLRNWNAHTNVGGYRIFVGEQLQNGHEGKPRSSVRATSQPK